MAINSKKKGNAFELKVANMMTKALGAKFIRSANSGAFATIHTDVPSVQNQRGDILYDKDTFYLKPWYGVIECKHSKDFRLYPDLWNPKSLVRTWMAKLYKEASHDEWLLIARRNNTEILAIVSSPFTAFSDLDDGVVQICLGDPSPVWALPFDQLLKATAHNMSELQHVKETNATT